jgi:hypothetical protein
MDGQPHMNVDNTQPCENSMNVESLERLNGECELLGKDV